MSTTTKKNWFDSYLVLVWFLLEIVVDLLHFGFNDTLLRMALELLHDYILYLILSWWSNDWTISNETHPTLTGLLFYWRLQFVVDRNCHLDTCIQTHTSTHTRTHTHKIGDHTHRNLFCSSPFGSNHDPFGNDCSRWLP